MKKKSLLLLLMAAFCMTGCGEKTNNSSSASVGSQSDSSSSAPIVVTPANGAYSFVASSYEERTKILGVLEKYAVDNYLTGITLYEDGGYVMYDPAVKKGTNTYIPGYGFGILSEGEITQDLKQETNPSWKRYYHQYETEDPNTLNYMNDKGSVVGGYVGYFSSSYFDTKMNETKDGYEWYGLLSKDDRPVALNADESGLATRYRIEVKTGSEFKYGTASSKFASYNGREVALDDYLTPYKILYTKAYGMERGADNLSGSGSLKGLQTYYNASESGFNAEEFAKIGIDASTENGKNYLTFEFNLPTNQFYAMYYISSSFLTSPVPEQFIKDLGNGSFDEGVKVYANFSSDLTLSPVDTTLSTGPYMVEKWDPGKEFVFKRNPNFVADNRYKIAGIHVKILPAAKTDPLAAFNQFLEGYLHASSIPVAELAEYKTDERTTTTLGSSTTKFNLNTCTKEEWEKLFGVNGSVAQAQSTSGYWAVKPIMSNRDFVRGLSYAINRKQIADKIGLTPSINYFGSSYMSNPEVGISYNSTQEHKDAIKDLLEGTDEYGYSENRAKAAFKKACDDLIASGAYKKGDNIELEVVYMSQNNVTNFGADVEKYWSDAFNSCGGGLTLSFKHFIPDNWQDVYFKKMMIGQYDIGFGGIEGNPLNPLNFLEVLKSDNSSTFTLNWGLDTNVCTDEIEYQGHNWSFDALWQAADQGAYVEDGCVVSNYDVLSAPVAVANADGSYTVTATVKTINIENVSTEFLQGVIFDYATGDDYDEDVLELVSNENGVVTLKISKELADKYKDFIAENPGAEANLGIDFYFSSTVCGISNMPLITMPFAFPE